MKINTNVHILLTVSFMILVFSSCKQRIKMPRCDHDKFIQEYINEDFESDTSIINCDYIFFADVGVDSVIITDNISLFEIYKSQYINKFPDFKIFLCSLYDSEIVLKKEDIDINIERINKIIFKKEESIIDSLRRKNIDRIKDYYFPHDDFFRTNIEIEQNEKYNILYFFFKNEYYISHSDYDGSFLITGVDANSAL